MNKKKKIILIHHFDDLGGAGISLLDLYKMLEEKYEVIIYLPSYNSRLMSYFNEHNIYPKALECDVGMVSSYSGGPSYFSRTYINKLIQIFRTKHKLIEIIKNEKPDVIGVNSITLAWTGKTISKYKIKSLCFIRETNNNSIGMKYLKNALEKYFNQAVFITEYDKNKFDCKKVKTGVVKDSVNLDFFNTTLTRELACEKFNLNKTMFNVLFVGGTSELKGWENISKLIKYIYQYNINIIVAGNIDPDKKINDDNIKYVGIQNNMPNLYRACDVLVFPSTFAHQSRPAFEAGIMGLPVIISDFEETNENVINGLNGLTFKPNDPEDLFNKILLLYSNREFLVSLGKSNYEHSIANHEFSICKNELTNLIEQTFTR